MRGWETTNQIQFRSSRNSQSSGREPPYPSEATGDWAEGQGIAFEELGENDFGLGVEGASGRRCFWTQAWKDEEEFVVSIGQREGGRKEGLQSSEGRERRTLSPREAREECAVQGPTLLGERFQAAPAQSSGCAGFHASARLPVGFRSLADSAWPWRSDCRPGSVVASLAPSRREAAATEGKG